MVGKRGEQLTVGFDTRSSGVNDECGCLEEVLDMHIGLEITIHMEPDGTGDMFIDAGDWQEEINALECKSIEDLRVEASRYASRLYEEGNGLEI